MTLAHPQPHKLEGFLGNIGLRTSHRERNHGVVMTAGRPCGGDDKVAAAMAGDCRGGGAAFAALAEGTESRFFPRQ